MPSPRIAVVRFSALGDVVLLWPVLCALSEAHPTHRITFFTRPRIAEHLPTHPNIEVVGLDVDQAYASPVALFILVGVVAQYAACRVGGCPPPCANLVRDLARSSNGNSGGTNSKASRRSEIVFAKGDPDSASYPRNLRPRVRPSGIPRSMASGRPASAPHFERFTAIGPFCGPCFETLGCGGRLQARLPLARLWRAGSSDGASQ